jgi:hypothetical protein
MSRLTLRRSILSILCGLFCDANRGQFLCVKLTVNSLTAQIFRFIDRTRRYAYDLTYLKYFCGVILLSAFREFRFLFANSDVLTDTVFYFG